MLGSSHQSTAKRQLLATEVNWKAIKAFFIHSEILISLANDVFEIAKLEAEKKAQDTRIDVQTRMYIVGIYAVLDNELSEFEIFPYFLAT